MAAYRADIEIGVKGIQQIGILQKKLEGTIYKIDDLNSKSVKTFGGVAQSIQNYGKQLALAEKALYRVAAGSPQEARAISNYVTALGNANALRSRQNKLIQDEIKLREELDRKNRLAASGIQEVSQYAQPIGPAPGTQAQYRRSRIRRFGGDVSPERAEAALRAKELADQQVFNQKFFAEERAQYDRLNKLRQQEIQNRKQQFAAISKDLGGRASSAIIGGTFPLLFGQSPQAAVGGAIGGLLGGSAGGFAGSLLGTALGEISAAQARTKELAAELGFSAKQAELLGTAFELAGRNSQQLEAAVTNIQGLGLSTNETASAIKIAVELSKEYGGSVEKISQAFADTLESGKVTITSLNKFTAQGIPIQDELAEKYGVSKSKILEMAKEGQISVQDLVDVLVKTGQEAEKTTDKGVTGFDKFTKAVANIATAVANAAGAILKNLVPALDTVLSKLSAIIVRATNALNLIADVQVGEASAALFRSGAARGTGFQNKGTIDDLTQGLKSLNPELATNKEQLDRIAQVAQRYRTELQQFGGQLGEYAIDTAQVELSRVQKVIAARSKALGTKTTQKDTGIGNINAPSQLSGTGGSSGRKPPENRTVQLLAELKAIDQIGAAENAIRDALFEGKELQVAQLELNKQIADIKRDQIKSLESANYTSEKDVINQIAAKREVIARLEYADRRREIEQKIFEESVKNKEIIEQTVQPLVDFRREQELQLKYSQNYYRLLKEGMLPAEAERIINFEQLVEQQLYAVDRQILLTEAAIRQAEAYGASTVELDKQLKLLKGQRDAITGQAAKGPGQGPTDAQRIQDAVSAARGELNTLTDPINQIIAGAKAIGNAFQQAFAGLVSGAMTGQQALATFFQGIADHFMDMATQIIAKLIEIWILKTVLGFISGGTTAAASAAPNYSGAFGSGGPSFNPKSFSMPNLLGRANGGPVTAGTPYIVGERGPELFVPGRSGTIVPNDKMGGNSVQVGSINISVENTGDTLSPQAQKQIAGQVRGIVLATLVDQQRSGGVLR